jgi:hypothetical protein
MLACGASTLRPLLPGLIRPEVLRLVAQVARRTAADPPRRTPLQGISVIPGKTMIAIGDSCTVRAKSRIIESLVLG